MLEIPTSVYCLNSQSLRNKAIPVTHYVTSQNIAILAPREMRLGTNTDQLTINEFDSNMGLIIYLIKWQTRLWY